MRSYGTLSVTSPASAPTERLTLTEVATHLGLSSTYVTDAAQVVLLETYIVGAREQAEYLQGRDLVAKQYDLFLDYFPCGEIALREPLISVDLMRYRDSDGEYTTMTEGAGADYIVDTARALVLPPYGESWPSFTPWPSSAIQVRFTSGMTGSEPFWLHKGKRLKVGMLYLISEWFNNRLPFELGANAVQEYPYSVTDLLRAGGKKRVR